LKTSRKTFFILGLITLFGFGSIGILIVHFFQKTGLNYLFSFGAEWTYQIYRGVLFGSIAALNMLWLIETPWLKEAKYFFSHLIDGAKLQLIDIIFLSAAAGIGEELFFRAGIQAFLGIWFTSVLFIVLHGYLNPKNKQILLYGTLMVVVSAGLGYLFKYIGLYAAMTAHFSIDLILFIKFRYFTNLRNTYPD